MFFYYRQHRGKKNIPKIYTKTGDKGKIYIPKSNNVSSTTRGIILDTNVQNTKPIYIYIYIDGHTSKPLNYIFPNVLCYWLIVSNMKLVRN